MRPYHSKSLLLLTVSLLLRFADGQTCQQAIIASAITTQGTLDRSLTMSDFKASYKGKPVAVSSAGFRVDPAVRIIVLLDTSASMAGIGAQGVDKWKIARLAASEFVSAAPQQARVSLISFGAAIEHTVDGASGRQPIEDWLNSPEMQETASVKGKKAIYATLSDVLKTMAPARPGDSIYMITDGRGDPKSENVSRVARELQSSGVRLFVFLLNDVAGANGGAQAGEVTTVRRGARPSPGPAELTDVARGSGGQVFTLYPGARSTLGKSFNSTSFDFDESTQTTTRTVSHGMATAITGFYVLSVSLPAGSSSLEDWKLEAVDSDGKKRALTLTYPAKIPGCDTPTPPRPR
jgi:hypothetical protein